MARFTACNETILLDVLMTLTLLPEYSLSDFLSLFTLKFGTEARVAGLPNGQIVATWSEPAGDRSIHVRMFAPDGAPLGPGNVVNTPSEHAHSDSQVTALANGGFVVTWSMTISGGEDNVFARVYGANGAPKGQPFLVSEDGGNVEATEDDDRFGDVVGTADGGAIFVWEARGPNDLYGRVLAPDGVTLGAPVLLNSAGEDSRVVQLANGDILVITGGDSNIGTEIRLSGPDLVSAPASDPGAGGPVFLQIDQTPDQHGTVTGFAPNVIQPLAAGGFVMGYRYDNDIRYDTPIDHFRLDWYDNAGALTKRIDIPFPAPEGGEEYSIGQVVPVEGDRLLIVWQVAVATSDFDILVQLLNADGTSAGDAQRLTEHANASQTLLEATVLDNGNVAVVWADASNGAVNGGIDPLHIRVVEIPGSTSQPGGPTSGDDTLKGTAARDVVDALQGDDVVSGLGGADRLSGGLGNDTLNGGAGRDVLIGGGGHDRLVGGVGNDRLFGNAGNDTLLGGGGDDSLNGSAGRDILRGGIGNDVLLGGGGPDRLFGESGADRLTGHAGNDLLNGGAGNDALDGGAGRDRMIGGGGNDRMMGGAGNDIMQGGGGRDRIDGGAGADRMAGGAGVDSFVFKGQVGQDVVTDFVVGVDRLVFASALFGGENAAQIVADGMVTGDGVLLEISATDSILLRGLTDKTGLEDDITIL